MAADMLRSSEMEPSSVDLGTSLEEEIEQMQGSQLASRPPSTTGKGSSWTGSIAGSEKSTEQLEAQPVLSSTTTFCTPSSLPTHSASAVGMAELLKKALQHELSSYKRATRRCNTDSAYSVLQDPVRLQSLSDSIILPLGEALQGSASITLLDYGQDGELLLPPTVVEELEGQHCPKYRINPEGVFKRGWDVVAVLLTYVLAIQIPMTIAYAQWSSTCSYGGLSMDEKQYLVGELIPLLTDWFFIADVGLHFFTGIMHQHDQRVDYRLSKISRRYLSSWFWLDVTSCIPFDCVWLLFSGSVPQYNISRLSRLLRLFGINRRTRGGPFSWMESAMENRGKWNYAAVELLSTVAHALLLMHFSACTMWFIVRVQGFPAGTWPVLLNIVSSDTAEQYLWSLFNAASVMIGLGYGVGPPVTWPEVLVWLVLIIISGLYWARINSLVFSLLFSSKAMSQALSQAIDQLMKLFRQVGNVPEELKAKALDAVRLRCNLLRDDAEFIVRYISADVFKSVMQWSAIDCIRRVPVLSSDQKLMEMVCTMLHEDAVIPGALVYRSEDPVEWIGFIRSGWVAFSMAGHRIGYAGPGSFIGEVALLNFPSVTEAASIGATAESVESARKAFLSVEAVTELKLWVLDRAAFHEMIATHFPVVCEELTEAAKERVRIFQKQRVRIFQKQRVMQHINSAIDRSLPPPGLSSESFIPLSTKASQVNTPGGDSHGPR